MGVRICQLTRKCWIKTLQHIYFLSQHYRCAGRGWISTLTANCWYFVSSVGVTNGRAHTPREVHVAIAHVWCLEVNCRCDDTRPTHNYCVAVWIALSYPAALEAAVEPADPWWVGGVRGGGGADNITGAHFRHGWKRVVVNYRCRQRRTDAAIRMRAEA